MKKKVILAIFTLAVSLYASAVSGNVQADEIKKDNMESILLQHEENVKYLDSVSTRYDDISYEKALQAHLEQIAQLEEIHCPLTINVNKFENEDSTLYVYNWFDRIIKSFNITCVPYDENDSRILNEDGTEADPLVWTVTCSFVFTGDMYCYFDFLPEGQNPNTDHFKAECIEVTYDDGSSSRYEGLLPEEVTNGMFLPTYQDFDIDGKFNVSVVTYIGGFLLSVISPDVQYNDFYIKGGMSRIQGDLEPGEKEYIDEKFFNNMNHDGRETNTCYIDYRYSELIGSSSEVFFTYIGYDNERHLYRFTEEQIEMLHELWYISRRLFNPY